jgi:hypothetical protein
MVYITSDSAYREHICMDHMAASLEVVFQALPGRLSTQIIDKQASTHHSHIGPATPR